jgi:hypothetical protein
MQFRESEGFHAPTLPDLTPAGTEIFLIAGAIGLGRIQDPTGMTPDGTTIRVLRLFPRARGKALTLAELNSVSLC